MNEKFAYNTNRRSRVLHRSITRTISHTSITSHSRVSDYAFSNTHFHVGVKNCVISTQIKHVFRHKNILVDGDFFNALPKDLAFTDLI